MPRILRNLAGLAAFFLLWELAVVAGLVDRAYLPPPTDVLTRTGQLLGQVRFERDVLATVLAWAISVGIAAAVAVPAGLLLGSVPAVRTTTRVVVEFLRPIPPAALIPLVLLLVGSGPAAKITLAVYASLWPMLFNTIYALSEIDPLLLDTAKACGTGRARTLTSVYLPHAAPFVFTGLRLSATIALIVVVSTEFLAGSSLGIGNFILDASSNITQIDEVMAGAVVAGLLGYLGNEGLELLGKRLFRWSFQATDATEVRP